MSQITFVDSEAKYDSLQWVLTKKSFKSSDSSKPFSVGYLIQHNKNKDTIIYFKTVATTKFLSYIKKDKEIIYGVYRRDEYCSLLKIIKNDTIVKVVKSFIPTSVFLVNTNGDLAAYTYDYGNDFFDRVKDEHYLRFKAKADTSLIFDIDPFAAKPDQAAFNKDKSAFMFVRLIFVDGKIKSLKAPGVIHREDYEK
jgi:hypothetical protein